MKKILMFFVVLMCTISCMKDYNANVYSNSTTVNGVTYGLEVVTYNEDCHWTVVNKTDEVALTYTFNYDRRVDLSRDFSTLVENIAGFDTALLPFFSQTLRTIDENPDALVYRDVDGPDVFIRFVIGSKNFGVPYNFILEANNKVNPQK